MRKWLVVLVLLVVTGAVLLVSRSGREQAAEHTAAVHPPEHGTAAPAAPAAGAAAPRARPARVSLRRQDGDIVADDEPSGPLLLEGQVLDQGELPVAGATVTIDTRPRRTTRTGQDGTFQFEHLIGRRYRLGARLDDQVAGPVLHQLTADSPPVILHLRRGSSVEVHVSNTASGRPLPGAMVELRSSENLSAVTNPAGTATFTGVASGIASVHAQAPGFAPARQLVMVPVTPGPQPVQVRLALSGGAAVNGIVVDDTGRPVAGARVLAVDIDRLIDLQDARRDGALSDEQGRFSIAALPSGSYRLQATHPDHPPATAGPVDCDGRHPVSQVRIVMNAGGSIAGRVVDAGGAPVPWATVRVGSQDSSSPRARRRVRRGGRLRRRQGTADENGEFSIKGLPRDRLLVVARGPDASSTTRRVDLSGTPRVDDLVLRLDVTGTISGQVVTSAGEPVAEVQVIARPDFWKEGFRRDARLRGRSQTMTDGGGNFELRGLTKGSYRLQASRSGSTFRRLGTGGVEARTGDRDVLIILDPEGGISGRVEFTGGGVPDSFNVAVGLPPGVNFTGTAGRFELSQVPSGTHQVSINGPGFAEAEIAGVEVRPGQVTDLGVVQLQPGRTVSGRVLEPDGTPVTGATVVVARQLVGDGKSLTLDLGSGADQRMGMHRTSSDENGTYRLGGIGNEEQVVVAEDAERGRSLPVELPAGPSDAVVDLILQGFGRVSGRVTVGGQPAGEIVVSAVAVGNAGQVVLVHAGEDGSYRFEKLPAGEQRISATRRIRGLGGRAESRLVTVRAGEETKLDIDIPRGQVELTVNVSGQDGAEIRLAQVLLLPGTVQASKVAELNKLATSSGGGLQSAFWNPQQPARFKEVLDGQYSVCVVPLDGDLSDPAFLMKLRKYRLQLDVHCRPLVVEPAPAQQGFTVVVPPMSPFPADPPSPAAQ